MSYSKKDIIDFFIEHDTETAGVYIYDIHGPEVGKQPDIVKYNTFYKRLDDIIQFLSDPEVIQALDSTSSHFYSRFMTLSKIETNQKPPFQFNLYDAIALAVLMGLYEETYFKRVRSKVKDIKNVESNAENWHRMIHNKLARYEELWARESRIILENENTNNKPETITGTYKDFYSLAFVLYGIVNVKSEQDMLDKIDERIKQFILQLHILPPDERIEFFDSKVKLKLNIIERDLEKYIQEMDEDIKAYYRTHKSLVKIDMGLE